MYQEKVYKSDHCWHFRFRIFNLSSNIQSSISENHILSLWVFFFFFFKFLRGSPHDSLYNTCLGEFLLWFRGSNLISITRTQVQSLALLSGLRICCGRELWCRSQTWLGSSIAVAVGQTCSYSSNLTPSLGTSICRGPKKTTYAVALKKTTTGYLFGFI